MTRTKVIVLAVFAALQVADVLSTIHVLSRGGFEGNPVGVWAMTTFGAYWPVPKLALMALCAALMVRWPVRLVAPLVGLMTIVVANNTFWAVAG